MQSFDDGGVRRCSRCGYRGDGVGYFSRSGHACLLVGLGLASWGIGAMIYWVARRHHVICPNCGLGWQHSRTLSEPRISPMDRSYPPLGDDHGPLPRGGGFRQLLGGVVMAGGLVLLSAGFFLGLGAEAVVAGAWIGAVGVGSTWWGLAARDNRRHAIRAQLQTRVLRLAARRRGLITVSDVATEFSLSLGAAERILLGMEDGLRVRSEIDVHGVILYEFPEFRRRSEISYGDSLPEPD